MVSFMAPRIIVRVEIPESARDQIDLLTRKLGMTHLSLHSRLVEWLSRQPEQIRAAILQQFPKQMHADIARLILRNMQQGNARADHNS
jgi:hypothetical protein